MAGISAMPPGQASQMPMNLAGVSQAPRQFLAPGNFQTTFRPRQHVFQPRFLPNNAVVGEDGSITYDGRRLKKPVHRRTVDYNPSVLKYLQNRIWQRDRRDEHHLQPDSLYMTEIVPPVAMLETPSNAVATRHVRTCMNKFRCPIFCLSWTPEGRRLVTGASSGEFTLWNGLSFSFETILQAHDSAVRAMKWSHSDSWMVTADHAGYIKYWQSNMNNVKMFQAHKEPVRGISFSPSDSKFASCSDDGTVRVWDFMRCHEERVLRGHGADVRCVGWHPQKALIASGSRDNQQPLKLWDPRTSNCLATLHAHKHTVMDLKWHQSGNWMLTASRDHLVKLFDIRKLKEEVQTFRGHKKEASTIAWHPVHESLFASGGADGAIMIWSVGCDHELGNLEDVHESMIWDLAWHPLGHLLVSGSNDHTIKFWARNRPGDDMKDKYNMNSLPQGMMEKEILEYSTEPSAKPALPGMGLEFGLPEHLVKEEKKETTDDLPAIPGLDWAADEQFLKVDKPKKVPFSRPVPKVFEQAWTGEIDAASIQKERERMDAINQINNQNAALAAQQMQGPVSGQVRGPIPGAVRPQSSSNVPGGPGGMVRPQGSRGMMRPQGSGGMMRPQGSRGMLRPQGSGGMMRPQGSGGMMRPQHNQQQSIRMMHNGEFQEDKQEEQMRPLETAGPPSFQNPQIQQTRMLQRGPQDGPLQDTDQRFGGNKMNPENSRQNQRRAYGRPPNQMDSQSDYAQNERGPQGHFQNQRGPQGRFQNQAGPQDDPQNQIGPGGYPQNQLGFNQDVRPNERELRHGSQNERGPRGYPQSERGPHNQPQNRAYPEDVHPNERERHQLHPHDQMATPTDRASHHHPNHIPNQNQMGFQDGRPGQRGQPNHPQHGMHPDNYPLHHQSHAHSQDGHPNPRGQGSNPHSQMHGQDGPQDHDGPRGRQNHMGPSLQHQQRMNSRGRETRDWAESDNAQQRDYDDNRYEEEKGNQFGEYGAWQDDSSFQNQGDEFMDRDERFESPSVSRGRGRGGGYRGGRGGRMASDEGDGSNYNNRRGGGGGGGGFRGRGRGRGQKSGFQDKGGRGSKRQTDSHGGRGGSFGDKRPRYNNYS